VLFLDGPGDPISTRLWGWSESEVIREAASHRGVIVIGRAGSMCFATILALRASFTPAS
jgi:hypothetical protein